MKKILILAGILVLVFSLDSCKAKRCKCTTFRDKYLPAISLEPKSGHKNCSELNMEWQAADSTHDLLAKTCEDYVE